MTEDFVLQTIENVVKRLAKKFSFPGFDPDDIAQEGRIMAMDALPRYKAEMGPLVNFLTTHVRRRLINLKRNHYRRTDPPCLECYHCDQEGRRPEHHDENGYCQNYLRWRSRNDRRACLAASCEANANDEQTATPDNASTDVEVKEILSLINRELPVELRSAWLRLRDDAAGVPAEMKRRMEKAIRDILERVGIDLGETGSFWSRAA
jgi:DNA-directed RNA polymerase specialized sigma24 family protein